MSQPGVNYESAPWQVGIRRAPDQPPVGGGMYCPDGHVITCAHVVAPDNQRPDRPVYVTFPHLGEHEPIPALVAESGWSPPSGKGRLKGDVAVLRLTALAPDGAAPPPLLRPSPEGVSTVHNFHTYGYPLRHPEGGVPARGTIVGQAEFEWVSLLSELGAQGLDPGFSGSPVWDVELRGVVGIVVLRDVPRSKSDHGGIDGIRNAYAIRMEALGGYWPALQPAIAGTSRRMANCSRNSSRWGWRPTAACPPSATRPFTAWGSPRRSTLGGEPAAALRAAALGRRGDAGLLDAGERFIVAVGDSKSGKSRSFAENLHGRRGGARLIVPASDPATLPSWPGSRYHSARGRRAVAGRHRPLSRARRARPQGAALPFSTGTP